MTALVRFGNAIGAAGIAVVLLITFGLQFALNELPCPLCALQRVSLALFGLHLYTWSALFLAAVIAGVALLMIIGGDDHGETKRFRGVPRFAGWLLVAVTFANAVNSFALCGPVECDPDPAGYWIAKVLR